MCKVVYELSKVQIQTCVCVCVCVLNFGNFCVDLVLGACYIFVGTKLPILNSYKFPCL